MPRGPRGQCSHRAACCAARAGNHLRGLVSLVMHEDRISTRQDVIRALADQGGAVLVIGDSDTGKTEFCKELLRAVLARGRCAAWIDADIGQSTLGPPSTVGMRVLRSISDLQEEHHPTEIHFVGSTSPTGYVVPFLRGIRRFLDLSRDAEPWATVIDTTGLATGAEGLELKRRKIELACPRHLVGFQRGGELEPLFRAYRDVAGLELTRLPVAPDVRCRSRADRRRHREERFRRYFLPAHLRTFLLESVSVSGHWIGSGAPAADSELARLSVILGGRVLYGERVHGHLMLFAQTTLGLREREKISGEFGVEGVHVHFLGDMKDRLVALHGLVGETLALGTAYLFDPEKRALSIKTPWEATSVVRGVIFGGIKVDSAGRETRIT